ncbi:MAG: flagellar basal body P-ring protein FlgI [Bdellovibrionota bacterium]
MNFIKRNLKHWIAAGLVATLITLLSTPAYAARLKDVADVEGVRGNQLFGYGLVVGLNGTGDGNKSNFTTQALSNMLENMGVRVDPKDLKVKNVAAVSVTTILPAFVRPGTKIDVTLSSIGDAKSIQGGTLLFTQLNGADGNMQSHRVRVSVGGFSIGTDSGDVAIQNHPTVG